LDCGRRSVNYPPSARDALIEANLDLPWILARRWMRRLWRVRGNLLMEELVGSGYVGLAQAAESYDGRASTTFRTWANHRVAGAMGDYLRTCHPLSAPDDRTTLDSLNSMRGTAAQVVARVEAHDLLNQLEALDTRFAAIARMRYLEGLSGAEIGLQYGISESMVSKIIRKALLQMSQFAFTEYAAGDTTVIAQSQE
jgi:RNA polymerase sigma factor (sigma-70 family)